MEHLKIGVTSQKMVTLKQVRMKWLSQRQNECAKWLGIIYGRERHTGSDLQYIQPKILSLILITRGNLRGVL